MTGTPACTGGVALRVSRGVALAAVLLATTACAVSGDWTRDCTQEDVSVFDVPPGGTRVVLVGDGGEASGEDGRVMLAAASVAARAPASTLVVFLGDNVYRDPGVSDWAAKIDAQIALVTSAKAQGVFVRGNHETYATPQDLARVEAHILRQSHRAAETLPLEEAGIGPAVIDRPGVRVVAMDTEKWLDGTTDGGPSADEVERQRLAVASAVRGAADRGERVLLVGHHPVRSHGRHGGFASWEDWLFSARMASRCAVTDWLPIPLVGVLMYRAGNSWFEPQNLANGRYAEFRRRIDALLDESGPRVIYAAGHDHSVQVIADPSGQLHVVSGAGSPGKRTPVAADDDTLFATSEAGFVVIDFPAAGSSEEPTIRAVSVPAEGGPPRVHRVGR